VKMSEVDRHLDETYFAWMGAVSDDGPFYYRVHSPVVLIEFDHHPGVAFDNPVPSPNHIHTLVRTPNGGDYGRTSCASITSASITPTAPTHSHACRPDT